MKNLTSLLSLLAICWGCSDNTSEREETPKITVTDPLKVELRSQEQTWAANGNAFAMNLFTAACEESEKENVLLSPFSLQIALGMLSNGASETGLNEIASAMGLENFSQQEVNDYFAKLTSAFAEGDPLIQINLANSAWIQNSFVVKNAFIKAITDHYMAQVYDVDFCQTAEVKMRINAWASEQTNGKINDLSFSINCMTHLVLANACYLKGYWRIPFEKVEKGSFTTSQGKVQKADMMKLSERFNYYDGGDYQAVDLPYGNESFSMVVVLPAKGKSVEQTAAAIDWESMWMSGSEVEVTLPKFKLEGYTELNPILMKLGIRDVFGTLPNIAEKLFVSNVFQDMFIETNETGTEAAAVTIIEIEVTTVGPEEYSKPVMTMDRPFLFAIRENSTGVILYMGKVGNLEQ